MSHGYFQTKTIAKIDAGQVEWNEGVHLIQRRAGLRVGQTPGLDYGAKDKEKPTDDRRA
jgi:hypothetical protein